MTQPATPVVFEKTRPKVHRLEFGADKFPCCGRSAYGVPAHDSFTTDPQKVTCKKEK